MFWGSVCLFRFFVFVRGWLSLACTVVWGFWWFSVGYFSGDLVGCDAGLVCFGFLGVITCVSGFDCLLVVGLV